MPPAERSPLAVADNNTNISPPKQYAPIRPGDKPPKRKAGEIDEAENTPQETAGKKPKAAPKKKAKPAEEVDLASIHLDGEEEDAVPVFETCDEVRKKIRAHLKKPGVTQAGFARECTAASGRNVVPRSINEFLRKKGPSAGNTANIFYAAYVYFEKLRLHAGKPKSKFREEMEKIHGPKGFDTERCHTRILLGPGERAHEDKYGHITIT
ncbi:hypothetical protein BP6252_12851 [Coleophoma cylindrospora]|uniref:DUF7726 domain-containing protein n=1 Tax=Coleophoma cylindrospora TaxID=1849047 RepID=A0A3D8QEB2_9HELO|nr:hypothetical protein BP6252_12851 [Coleophoma cylindrospora]